MNKKKHQPNLKTKVSFKRKVVTLGRIVRYGFANFIRNAWLSLAATIIMTITLMIIIFAVFSTRPGSPGKTAARAPASISLFKRR